MSQSKDENKQRSVIEKTKEVVDSLEQAISITGAALTEMGESLPGMVGKVGKAAEIVSSAISEPGQGWVEKATCGTVRVVTQNIVAAPLAGVVFTNGAVMNISPNPYHRAALGITAYLTMAPVINEVTKPYGEAASTLCHKAFDLFQSPANKNQPPDTPNPTTPAPITPAKQKQKNQATHTLMERTVREQAINGSQYNPPSIIPSAKYTPYTTPYRPFYNPPTAFFLPIHVRAEVNRYLTLYGNKLSFSDRMTIERRVEMACSFLQMQTSFGYSQSYGLGNFHANLAMNHLISSYNSYNIESLVREAVSSTGDIGGVAGDAGVITDLIDSDAHANASSYFFCFPKESFPFPKTWINQIACELKSAYFTHKTLPFFSLHFNNQGFMYPVHHTAYEKTLTGEIIAFLDYWMKGFLNGGIFDEDFLQHWHERSDCNEQALREKLIDLKKYHKTRACRYISLRELENRYGLSNKNEHSAYNQPYRTSFRIIAYQEQFKREGNILIPMPHFRVEYSIDLMPDYKEYLEKYHHQHGEYPQDYEHTRLCYELFAKEIQEKMPQMPICRDYFQLLGVINSFCYAYVTLAQMGKIPVLEESTATKTHFIPKAFPPIPVRTYQTYPIQTTFGNLFTLLLAHNNEVQIFDDEVFSLFVQREKRTFSEPLNQKFQQIILQHIRTELSKVPSEQNMEINDEEIELLCQKNTQFLMAQIQQTRAMMSRLIQVWLEPLAKSETQSIRTLPINEKIKATRDVLEKRFCEIKAQWEVAASLDLHEIMLQFPKIHHPRLTTLFARVDEQLKKELKEIIYLYKKSAGILKPEDQLDEATLGILPSEKQAIEKEFQSLELEIRKRFDEEALELNSALTESANIKVHCQNQVIHGNQLITQLQQKINQCPANMRTDPHNVAIINSLTAEIKNIQTQVNEFQKKITELDARISKRNEGLNSAPNRKAESIAQSKRNFALHMLTQLADQEAMSKLMAYKAVGIEELNRTHERTIQFLQQFDQQIHQFSQSIQRVPELQQHVLSHQYTHTTMGFTSEEHIQNGNQRFKIVGGTGMDLHAIQTIPIPHSEAFSEQLAKTLLAAHENQAMDFKFNDQHYVVHELSVTDERLSFIDTASNPKTQIVNPKGDITALMNTHGTDSLDCSGGTFVHYAATVLDAQEFIKINPELWQQLDSLGNLPLHYAAQSGNTSIVLEILKRYPDQIECKNTQGLTPLFLAVQHDKKEMVHELLAHQGNVNITLANGLFPLYIAVQNNFHDLALWLIHQAPSLAIDQEVESKMTALHLAINAKQVDIAIALIEKGASCTIQRKSDGFTAVHSAAKHGLVSVLITMKNKGITLNQVLESGKTALHLAAVENQLETLDFLLNAGADAQAKTTEGETPLMLAIKGGNLEAALKLAKYSAIDTVNNQKQAASLLAIQYGLAQVADLLFERGENPELLDQQGHNCVYYLIRNGEESRFSDLLAKKKIDPHQEFHGANTIELAARYGQFLIVYDLLDLQVAYRNKSGLSLVDHAVVSDEISFVQEHLKETHLSKLELACLAAQHRSMTCLTWMLKQFCPDELDQASLFKSSLQSHQPQVIELIIKRVNPINQVLDSQGNTALHLSVIYGAKQAIELLLQRGAAVNLRNGDGQTVFHIALVQEDKASLKKLFQLTQPEEWPIDLWTGSTCKPGHDLYQTMMAFKSQMPSQVFPVEMKQELLASSLPSITLTAELKNQISQLKAYLKDGEYDEAYEFLTQYPGLIKLFDSEQGADLLQVLFAHLHDDTPLLTARKDHLEVDDESVFSSPHKLLDHLKQSGINPARLTGKYNVLLSMLSAESDEEACFRLRVFNQYFPQSLTILALDKGNGPVKMVEMALKLNKKQLFNTLDELCSKHFDPEKTSFNSVHEAVIASNYGLVESLLQRYPADSLNNKRQTALMIAAQLNHVRIMELLLDKGADPDCLDIYGQNALHYALMSDSADAALTLLPCIRYKNQPNRSGVTPLMLASRQGLTAIIRFLCEESNYSDSFDRHGLNALHHAALCGQAKTIVLLKSYGFDINGVESPSSPKKVEYNLKRTPLHLAAKGGHLDAVLALLSLGAHPEQEDARQFTFFEYAVLNNKNHLIEVLQQMDGYQQKRRDTPLLLAATQSDNVDILCQLILSDVNLNASDASGLTALHTAAIYNSIRCARLLLAGHDVALDVLDQNAMTPLHFAARFGHVVLIEALHQAGAKPDYHNKNQPTALFLACDRGHLGAVCSLLKFKADFIITNEQGITPAQIALINGHIAIAKAVHAVGDTSLNREVITTLPKTMQDKLYVHYSLFLQSVNKIQRDRGDLLVSQGIYRKKPSAQSESDAAIRPTL